MSGAIDVAVVGATGVVGEAMLEILADTNIYGGDGDYYVADFSQAPASFTYQSRRRPSGQCSNNGSLFNLNPHYPAVPISLDFQEPFQLVVRQ